MHTYEQNPHLKHVTARPPTCPAGAYADDTVLGKHALLTKPVPMPLRYRMLSGEGALAALKYRQQVPTPSSGLEGDDWVHVRVGWG